MPDTKTSKFLALLAFLILPITAVGQAIPSMEYQSGSVFVEILNAAIPPNLGIPTVPNAPPLSLVLIRSVDPATTGFSVAIKLKGSAQVITQYSDKIREYTYTGFFVSALLVDIESVVVTEVKPAAQFSFIPSPTPGGRAR